MTTVGENYRCAICGNAVAVTHAGPEPSSAAVNLWRKRHKEGEYAPGTASEPSVDAVIAGY